MKNKLLVNNLPIDRVAARVIKPSKNEDNWDPHPKNKPTFIESSEFIKIKPPPHGAPDVIGKRRGDMVIIGYAAEQGSGLTKWVVRCVCGNYEQRTKITRWLGVDAPDSCRVCQNRKYLISKKHLPPEPPVTCA